MTKPRAIHDREYFLALLLQALESVREERFFQDERGFQGALLQELSKRMAHGAFPGDPIIEQEYQKRLPLHGIKIRPDIIIHVPFERGLAEERDEGNFVAMELKRRASAKGARAAFANLAQMKKALKYPLTIFVNGFRRDALYVVPQKHCRSNYLLRCPIERWKTYRAS